ncbi:hypothetical protein DR094_00155 [Mycoplasma flocculare]|uniref:Uncharacterized protein n=1 Tax=Mesomycoplasma flocculare TaxID=2128 RepID=A0AAW9XAG7_MESFC|nr:hypothetical protein [Mesomycoplasma flocculare]MXR13431.1 hypothetical protein [Mesomycoplasma flocculare]MXR39383.1 hypothetical protein [Mycoplasma sp. MF12]MXR56425.1 hypothetical protein [Mesomycoplasma flocculare]
MLIHYFLDKINIKSLHILKNYKNFHFLSKGFYSFNFSELPKLKRKVTNILIYTVFNWTVIILRINVWKKASTIFSF